MSYVKQLLGGQPIRFAPSETSTTREYQVDQTLPMGLTGLEFLRYLDTGTLPPAVSESQLAWISAMREMVDTGLQEIKGNVQGSVVSGVGMVAGAAFGVGRVASQASEAASGLGWIRPPGWRLPKNGKWEGTPGHSNFFPEDAARLGLKEGEAVPFKCGKPDFTKWSQGTYVAESPLTGFHAQDQAIMKRTLAKQQGGSINDVETRLKNLNLVLHHSGENEFQLVPQVLHSQIRATGSAFELRQGVK